MAEVGRPTVMTEATLRKLEEAFAMGCTDLEACLYADISKSTLYDYQQANPDFLDRKEKLKETTILLARKTVVNSLTNPQTAQWYLERKRKHEFAARVENTGANGEPLIPKPILGAIHVPTNPDHNQDSPVVEADQGGTGGNLSQQDNLDTPPADTGSPDRPSPDPDQHS